MTCDRCNGTGLMPNWKPIRGSIKNVRMIKDPCPVCCPYPNLSKGYKVFIYGRPDPLLKGRWITSPRGPGFHVFTQYDSAVEYAKGHQFAYIAPVNVRNFKCIVEPQGEAMIAHEMMVL